MQGMVGTRPRGGKGQIYEKYLKQWKDSDDDEFPGVIHTSKTEQVSNELFRSQCYHWAVEKFLIMKTRKSH